MDCRRGSAGYAVSGYSPLRRTEFIPLLCLLSLRMNPFNGWFVQWV
jgi:hypothetical protein